MPRKIKCTQHCKQTMQAGFYFPFRLFIKLYLSFFICSYDIKLLFSDNKMNGDKDTSSENSREITDFQNLTINFDEIKLSENELKLLEKQNSRIVADFKGILSYYIYIY